MANRYAVKSGNWSDPATWDGGVNLPTVGDVVRPNGFTVEIDQDIEVLNLANNIQAPAIAGGVFTINTLTEGLTRNIRFAETYLGQSKLKGSNLRILNVGSMAGEVIIHGHVRGGEGDYSIAIAMSGSCLLTIKGSVYGGYSGFYPRGLVVEGSGQIVVEDSVVGGAGTTGGDAIYSTAGDFSLTVLKDVYTTHSNGAGIVMGEAAKPLISVYGNAYGGAQDAIRIGGPASLTLFGSAIGGNTLCYGVEATAASAVIDLQGPIIASSTAAGAYLVGPTTVRVKGPLVHHKGTSCAPLVASFFAFHENTQTSWTVMDDTNYPAGNPVVLSNYVTNSPPPADVRSGTIYGPESALVGTLELPQPEQVASGVGVDATEGISAVRLSDVAAITGSQIAATFD